MKDIVIIGGGFAGSYIAKNLEKKFNTYLIDDKNYFEFTPSILRTLVEPKKINKIKSEHKKYLKKANVLMGCVKSIDNKYVYLTDKKSNKIKYDYLVICTGSNYSSPIKSHNLINSTRSENLIKSHETLKDSKSTLIIGGGLVGVELAAEIISHFPDKEVILISSSDRLIKRNSEKSINYAENYLIKRKVRIIRGERVISTKGNQYYTNKGNVYKSDISFLCTGISPNYKFMVDNFKDSINEKNQIIINEYLQVKGQKNIFCAGDVNNIDIEKTAQSAISQAKTIVKNISRAESNKPLKKHKEEYRGLAISLGKYDGIYEYNNFVITGKIPAFMKFLIERFEMISFK
jgi:NADH dehydrogenase FAD-containing subunit